MTMKFTKGQCPSCTLHINKNRGGGNAISYSRMNSVEKYRRFLTGGLFNIEWYLCGKLVLFIFLKITPDLH